MCVTSNGVTSKGVIESRQVDTRLDNISHSSFARNTGRLNAFPTDRAFQRILRIEGSFKRNFMDGFQMLE